jgi:hypothetical protein
MTRKRGCFARPPAIGFVSGVEGDCEPAGIERIEAPMVHAVTPNPTARRVHVTANEGETSMRTEQARTNTTEATTSARRSQNANGRLPNARSQSDHTVRRSKRVIRRGNSVLSVKRPRDEMKRRLEAKIQQIPVAHRSR